MLTIMLPATDDSDAVELKLEHSLVSLSKWESIHEKAFFGREEKTFEDTVSYVEQMILTENPPVKFVERLTKDDFEKIAEYINGKHSATWFREEAPTRAPSEVITSELIYYWMIQFQIPFKPVDEWNLSRLMTLIKIAGVKQSKPKKMSRHSLAEQYRQLNAQRREQYGTAG